MPADSSLNSPAGPSTAAVQRLPAEPGWQPLVSATGAGPARQPPQLRRLLVQLTVAALLLVSLVAVAGSLLSRRIAGNQAVHEVAQTTDLLAESVLQPSLTDQMATDQAAAQALDPLIRERILPANVVRVKLWSAQGVILYSDERQLIGRTFALDEGAAEALSSPRTQAEITDLSRPENAFERSRGTLLEVYRPVWTPSGHELLFEAYFPYQTVTDRSSQLWRGFVGITLSSVVLIFLLLMPIVWTLLRRARDAQLQREAMMQRALDASADERKRIAGALHDGIVQELAAASFAVSGAAASLDQNAGRDTELADRLRTTAATLRTSLVGLRSLTVDIYPAALRSAGLPAVLRDLAVLPADRGPQVRVEIDPSAAEELTEQQQQAMFRVAQECLRNTVRHAAATEASIELRRRDNGVCLQISDNGAGFELADRRSQRQGHLGLTLLQEVAASVDGELSCRTSPGQGASWRLWVRTR